MSNHPCPGGCPPGGEWVDFQGQDLEDVRETEPGLETYRVRMCAVCDNAAQIQATYSVPQKRRRR